MFLLLQGVLLNNVAVNRSVSVEKLKRFCGCWVDSWSHSLPVSLVFLVNLKKYFN